MDVKTISWDKLSHYYASGALLGNSVMVEGFAAVAAALCTAYRWQPAFPAGIAGLFLGHPLLRTDLAPLWDGAKYDLFPHRDGEIINKFAREISTFVASIYLLLAAA
jgi:hypothetical protein